MTTDRIYTRSQEKKDMNKNTDSIETISDSRTGMSDRMDLEGKLPRNNKERVVVQVLNATHART